MEFRREFPPKCPRCNSEAFTSHTRYGQRHSCCGLHSWDGKPLVSQEVHDARQRCHAMFDPIWKNAEKAYDAVEPHAIRKVRKTMRNRAYHYIAHKSGLTEPECHMSWQDDLGKLALIEQTCRGVQPRDVREWWKRQ